MFIEKITWEGTSEVLKAELTSDLELLGDSSSFENL